MPPSPPRSWVAFRWSWTERVVVALLTLLPIATLALGAGWLAGVLALPAFAGLNVVVYRHGGWRLLGPHFYYDVVRLARRGRSTLLRIVYILALFGGLAYVFDDAPVKRGWEPNDFARVSQRFAYTLFVIQNVAIVVLTPVYLASAVAEERERRTLELLFTTQLSDTEIILGKLVSRIIHLFGFVIAGFPILSVIQFWGGIDMLLIAGNLINTLFNILTFGSICLLVSVLCKTVSVAVMTSYALASLSFCCGFATQGFPFVLQDARLGGERLISVQDLVILSISHLTTTAFCLGMAVMNLREQQGIVLEALTPPPRPSTAALPVRQTEAETLDAFSIPYTLPPVPDHSLLWKERFLGGPPWFFSPLFVVVALPLTATAFMIMTSSLLRILADADNFREAAEFWADFLRFYYYAFLACYVLGVAFRAAASVARERQQQTLEPLLLLQIDRSAILNAKWLGSLMRGWPWLVLLLIDIVVGTLIGAYHPYSAVLLCLAPWPMIFFFTSLGLFLSVVMRTVLRANLVMALAAMLFVSCGWLNCGGRGPTFYLEPLAFSAWNLPAHAEHDFTNRFYFSLVAIVFYLVGAVVSWRAAVVWFENKASRAP